MNVINAVCWLACCEVNTPVGLPLTKNVNVQDEPTEGISWSVTQDFKVNEDDFLNFDQSGRFISVRFEDPAEPGATGNPIWSIHGFDIEYTFQGDFSGR